MQFGVENLRCNRDTAREIQGLAVTEYWCVGTVPISMQIRKFQAVWREFGTEASRRPATGPLVGLSLPKGVADGKTGKFGGHDGCAWPGQRCAARVKPCHDPIRATRKLGRIVLGHWRSPIHVQGIRSASNLQTFASRKEAISPVCGERARANTMACIRQTARKTQHRVSRFSNGLKPGSGQASQLHPMR